MSTEKRLKLVIAHLINKKVCDSQKDLGEKLGYSSQYSFSTACIKRPNVVIPKLKKFYPLLNLDYLFENSEQMFLTEEQVQVASSEKKIDYYNNVQDVFTALKFPNWKQFWRTLNYENGQLFYDLKSGKAKKLPEDFVEAVCKKYEHVNPDYLLKGEGLMFRNVLDGIGDSLLESESEPQALEPELQLQPTAAESVTDYKVSAIYPPEEPHAKSQLLDIDLCDIDKMTIREYSKLNADKIELINRCSLLPQDTIIYKVHSECLEPFAQKNDYLFLRLIEDKAELKNHHVYLVDSESHGKLVKRLEIQEDCYVLSGSFTRRDFPIVKISKAEKDTDFYDLVCKVVNDFSKIFSEKVADMHYMAVACVEANKGLIENCKMAEENVRLAQENTSKMIDVISNLSKK